MDFLKHKTDFLKSHSFKFHRLLMLFGGVAYLVWWFAVEALLPGSFNPLGSRLAVVGYCFAMFAISFWSEKARHYVEKWSASCLWLITLHYFYLFHNNQSDINWVVGSYITIIAVCACFQSERCLLTYSVFVLTLSLLLVFQDRVLLQTTFLPGIITILTFAYLGLRRRLRLSIQSEESSKWFQNLFDSVFEGIVIHHDMKVLGANEAFSKIFGYGRKEVHGMRIVDFVTADAKSDVTEKIKTLSEEPYETTGIKKDGTLITLEIRGKQHWMEGKQLRLAAIRDITERKRNEQTRMLYEAAQESVRMRDEFISIASHELKTPLTSLKLQAQMTMKRFLQGTLMEASPEKIKTLISTVEQQTNRLIKLVEEMLDVSRISSGKMEMNLEEFDLQELVKKVVESFDSLLRYAECSVEIESSGNSVIFADRFRFEQVIVNLLTNAAKYGHGMPILIRIQSDETETRLSFKDQGIGIAKEDQERVFQRYERAVSANHISGLGLGLYITKTIIDAHHGRIELKSEVGKGAEFIVHLPRKKN